MNPANENPVVPDRDRRRSPRFDCSGVARVICLPFEGVLLLGKIRNLSLGGCCLELAAPLPQGTKAEVLVRVDALSFRALCQVLAIQNRSNVCMQFLRLSAGGREFLGQAIAALEQNARRAQILQQQNAPELEPQAEPDQPQLVLPDGNLARFPVLRTAPGASTAEPKVQLVDENTSRLSADVLLDPLDLFI